MTTLQSGQIKTLFIESIPREELFMNINVTIGVTPQLEKLLSGLSSLINVVSTVEKTEAPSQSVFQQAIQQAAPQSAVQPQVQQAPTPQPPQPVQPTPVQPAPVVQPPMQQAPTPQAVPTSAPTYTMDQLAKAATQLMDAGKREDLLQLLSSFGASALMQVPQEQYGAFATKLREMGAQI